MSQTAPAYNLTRESLNTITDAEIAFGTVKLLPPYAEVPDDFKRGNHYTDVMNCLFFGKALPEIEMEFREGFQDNEALIQLNRVVSAHLRSFAPKHEHKIAGLGYLLSLVCVLHPA